MNLAHLNAVITGASGGIGAAIAGAIIHHGGSVVITGRDPQALSDLVQTLDPSGQRILALAADVTRTADRQRLCEAAMNWRGGVNALINNAGVSDFGLFTGAGPADIEHAFAVNALAPLQLCRALLPHLLRQPQAHIVNVGSVFGAIAYPGHAVYSATKFALRGFSEALRRELSGSTVRIHYLAPRATRTKFNSRAVEAFNDQFGIAMDQPARVAECLCRMLQRGQAESVIGWPEKLFARLNAVLPRLVDHALAGQVPAIREYTAEPEPEQCRIPSLSRRAS